MDELTQYVFINYPDLRTPDENRAYTAVVLEAKIAHSKDVASRHQMRRKWAEKLQLTPQTKALLYNGTEAFQKDVCDRIMSECSDQVFLNYCPRCGALARRPQSKQCPKCFYSWHDAVPSDP